MKYYFVVAINSELDTRKHANVFLQEQSLAGCESKRDLAVSAQNELLAKVASLEQICTEMKRKDSQVLL